MVLIKRIYNLTDKVLDDILAVDLPRELWKTILHNNPHRQMTARNSIHANDGEQGDWATFANP